MDRNKVNNDQLWEMTTHVTHWNRARLGDNAYWSLRRKQSKWRKPTDNTRESLEDWADRVWREAQEACKTNLDT